MSNVPSSGNINCVNSRKEAKTHAITEAILLSSLKTEAINNNETNHIASTI